MNKLKELEEDCPHCKQLFKPVTDCPSNCIDGKVYNLDRLVVLSEDESDMTNPLDGMNVDYDEGFLACYRYMLNNNFKKIIEGE